MWTEEQPQAEDFLRCDSLRQSSNKKPNAVNSLTINQNKLAMLPMQMHFFFLLADRWSVVILLNAI